MHSLGKASPLAVTKPTTRKRTKQLAAPRNNMPLELGVCIGKQRYNSQPHQYLVMVEKSHDHKPVFSDLGGEDPSAHGATIKGVIREVRNWLALRPTCQGTLAGPKHLTELYERFQERAPELAARYQWEFDGELPFVGFVKLVVDFMVEANRHRQELTVIEARAAVVVQ